LNFVGGNPDETKDHAQRTENPRIVGPILGNHGGFAMSDPRRTARRFQFSFLISFSGLTFALSSSGWAQTYPPDGPDIPTITLNEGQEGAAGLPPLEVPPPKGFDQQSIWNMKVVGFNDNQGRPSSDDGWIENQNGRYIVYMTSTGGSMFNPITGQVDNSGTSLIDATNPRHPILPGQCYDTNHCWRIACGSMRRQHFAGRAEEPLVHASA